MKISKLSLSLLLLIAMMLRMAPVLAQEQPQGADPLPLDPELISGTLPNGLQYYIRKNAKPENIAELRLAVNAGSILENDNQQGLAHFVEHMCFNGTKNFPKQKLIDFLELQGTKFGAHLNAYTSFDETVYMLRVPTDSAEVLETGFQILEDWAHNVSFEAEEIEKERGVVIEEWRTRLGAFDRMQKIIYPHLYYKSRYADRLPIGKTNILESFDRETLVQYYRDWYRPDLMAVIAVGDFDPQVVEAIIKEHFGSIPASEDSRMRTLYPVPDHEETIITSATDAEAPYNVVSIYHKHDRFTQATLDDRRIRLIQNLCSDMLDSRLDEIMQSENPPFSFAYSGYGSLRRSKDSYTNFALVPDNGFEKAIEVLLTENERARRHGFSASELARAKRSVLSQLKRADSERDKTESRRHASGLVYHYLQQSPFMGTANMLAIAERYLPTISIEEVNAMFGHFVEEKNRVITMQGIDKEGNALPDEEAIRSILQKVSAAEITAFVDNVAEGPLMPEIPAAGAIVAETKLADVGVTELRFENGVRVILKPTDFKNDEIQFRAFSPGGTSRYEDDMYMSASMSADIISQSGLGSFTPVQLEKYLSDKNLMLFPYIQDLEEGFYGNSTRGDFETLLQMVSLYFSTPRKDEIAFSAYMTKKLALYTNLLSNPDYYFLNEVYHETYGNHYREEFIPSLEKIKKIDLDQAYEVFRDRFGDASDFTFVIVGSIDSDEIRDLLSTYLGSLPKVFRIDRWKDRGIRYPESAIAKDFYKGSEPKSSVSLEYYGLAEWSPEEEYRISSAVQILRMMMRESMREDMGGVYGVRVNSDFERYPVETYSVQVSFMCSPENVDDLIKAAQNDIATLKLEGPSEINLEKIKKIQLKEVEEGLKKNEYWARSLTGNYRNSLPANRILQQKAEINALTAEEIQATVEKYFSDSRLGKFVLYPEKESPSEGD